MSSGNQLKLHSNNGGKKKKENHRTEGFPIKNQITTHKLNCWREMYKFKKQSM